MLPQMKTKRAILSKLAGRGAGGEWGGVYRRYKLVRDTT